jgi:hypothetical protein
VHKHLNKYLHKVSGVLFNGAVCILPPSPCPPCPFTHPSIRFVMGSNKVLQVALGKSSADELRTNLSQLSEKLVGQVGLLFTKMSKEEVSGRGAEWCAVCFMCVWGGCCRESKCCVSDVCGGGKWACCSPR